MSGQVKIASAPAGYSLRQIALHWIVFVLVAFQFVMGDNMTHLFRAAHGGRSNRHERDLGADPYRVGFLILIAMLARLALRRLDGVPAPPKQHPALEWLASVVHAGLYVDLIGAPIVGVDRLFLSALVRRAAPSHDPADPRRSVRAAFRRRAVALARRSRRRDDADGPPGRVERSRPPALGSAPQRARPSCQDAAAKISRDWRPDGLVDPIRCAPRERLTGDAPIRSALYL